MIVFAMAPTQFQHSEAFRGLDPELLVGLAAEMNVALGQVITECSIRSSTTQLVDVSQIPCGKSTSARRVGKLRQWICFWGMHPERCYGWRCSDQGFLR